MFQNPGLHEEQTKIEVNSKTPISGVVLEKKRLEAAALAIGCATAPNYLHATPSQLQAWAERAWRMAAVFLSEGDKR